MTKYPCANSRCVNDVKVPGQYCPKCDRENQEAWIKSLLEDQQKENDRKRYERHHGKDDKK